jgi:hypothetical protein
MGLFLVFTNEYKKKILIFIIYYFMYKNVIKFISQYVSVAERSKAPDSS